MADDIKNDDTVTASQGDDTIKPDTGNDTVADTAGDDTVQGDDTVADTGNDTVDDNDPGEFDANVWGTTGDETGDSVLHLLHESGVSVDDAKALLFDKIKDGGDPADIDRDALIEKVGKVHANLIMTGIKGLVSETREAEKAAVAVVHSAAGGKDNWDKVLPWLNSNKVSEDDRAEYAALIDKGGKSAELAVRDLVSKYNADPNNKSIGKREIVGDTRKDTPVEGLSQKEYGDKLQLLHRTGQATEAARADLLAKRRAGRAAGL